MVAYTFKQSSVVLRKNQKVKKKFRKNNLHIQAIVKKCITLMGGR